MNKASQKGRDDNVKIHASLFSAFLKKKSVSLKYQGEKKSSLLNPRG